jgi:hypothetical protein
MWQEWKTRNAYRVFTENLKGKNLEDLSIVGRII